MRGWLRRLKGTRRRGRLGEMGVGMGVGIKAVGWFLGMGMGMGPQRGVVCLLSGKRRKRGMKMLRTWGYRGTNWRRAVWEVIHVDDDTHSLFGTNAQDNPFEVEVARLMITLPTCGMWGLRNISGLSHPVSGLEILRQSHSSPLVHMRAPC
jgi:hypothetical protein